MIKSDEEDLILKLEEDFLNDEKEDLLEQLSSKERVMINLKESIRATKEVERSHKDLIASLQQSGRFLEINVNNNDEAYLRKEIEILKEQIQDLNTDISMSMNKKDNLNKNIELVGDSDQEDEFETLEKSIDDLTEVTDNLEIDLQRVREERDELMNEIKNERMKEESLNEIMLNILSKNSSSAHDVNIKVHDVMENSLELQETLEEAIAIKKHSINLAKMAKDNSKLVDNSGNNSSVMSYNEASRTLSALTKLPFKSHIQVEYLQKLSLALMEAVDIKTKVLKNTTRGNKTLGNRVQSLSKYIQNCNEIEGANSVHSIEASDDDRNKSPNITLRQPKRDQEGDDYNDYYKYKLEKTKRDIKM